MIENLRIICAVANFFGTLAQIRNDLTSTSELHRAKRCIFHGAREIRAAPFDTDFTRIGTIPGYCSPYFAARTKFCYPSALVRRIENHLPAWGVQISRKNSLPNIEIHVRDAPMTCMSQIFIDPIDFTNLRCIFIYEISTRISRLELPPFAFWR